MRALRLAGLDRPLLNGTGLEGKYRIALHWTPSDSEGADPGILNALKAQTALIVRKRDLAVEVLVIDHANRTPTANP